MCVVDTMNNSKYSQHIRETKINQALVVIQIFLECVGFWISCALFASGKIVGSVNCVVFGITLGLPFLSNSV